MKRLVHLHHYRALLRSLFIAVFIGVAAALAVWLFHRSMIGLEWLLLGNADGSLAAAAALPGWRRALTPALGGGGGPAAVYSPALPPPAPGGAHRLYGSDRDRQRQAGHRCQR